MDKTEEFNLYRKIPGPAADGTRLEETYRPVSCDFSDRLEDLSVRGLTADFAYWSAPRQLERVQGKISNIYTTSDKEEYVELDNGTEIRLDRIFEARVHRMRPSEEIEARNPAA